ncbi:hypothetical protein E2493_19205 [Sphingomonas parva]|uniref:Uncharacterized protein n=1 Tax=Sphingomonas parva TaxID=2555898 RepID=A0A4Y8ZKT7_9SPHN|nr:hypothetical protein [Sphingomonas parva]TFI56640.1 hypothetical protein E2493_19205 [Sphingomonas parva]
MARKKRPTRPEDVASSGEIQGDALAAASDFWTEEEMKKARPISLDRNDREKGNKNGKPE